MKDLNRLKVVLVEQKKTEKCCSKSEMGERR